MGTYEEVRNLEKNVYLLITRLKETQRAAKMVYRQSVIHLRTIRELRDKIKILEEKIKLWEQNKS